MPKKGYYSADAIIGRARVQAEQQAAERAQKPEVQPEQEIQNPGTDFKLPTPNQTEQVLPDVKDWDYKTAQTDMQGNPLKTREFMGAEITPKGFDPNGNPYFGGGVKGWLQKWGYKLSEESATDKEADLAWDAYLDTAKQFSENFINGFTDEP